MTANRNTPRKPHTRPVDRAAAPVDPNDVESIVIPAKPPRTELVHGDDFSDPHVEIIGEAPVAPVTVRGLDLVAEVSALMPRSSTLDPYSPESAAADRSS